MKKHLFLEGDMRLGKSHIIRQALLPYEGKIGGFFAQRVYVEERYQAFILNELEDIKRYNLERRVQNISEVNPFLYCSGDRWEIRKEVFAETALRALKRAGTQRKKVILMDEIGGVELGIPDFVNLLMEVLKGDISCLGVLKSSKNAAKMRQKLAVKKSRSPEKEAVMNRIKKHPQVELLLVTEENLQEASLKVNSFVRRCMDAGGKSLVKGADRKLLPGYGV